MNGAQACEILNWIERALQEHQIDFRKDIKFWTLGIGPGSFSALRIAAALFAGLTFQRSDFFVRSIPSITAIFDSMPDNAENPAVLFDGRRNEIFCFSSPEQREPGIVKEPNEIDKFDYVYALREHETAIQSFFKDKSAEITMLEEFPIIKLLENKKEYTAVESIDYFYEDLIYLRPPV
jgi:tRNA A37 threonylcarbamoyladenosine modification protein TsaB